MAKVRPEYEVNNEFNTMAAQLVEKHSDKFYGIPVDRICCVNIINKDRPESKKGPVWDSMPVKMPMALHCAYGLYVTLYSSDWNAYTEKQKLLLVADILHTISVDDAGNIKILAMDTKGNSAMFRTFKGIDYMDDPNSPNLLTDEIKWIK